MIIGFLLIGGGSFLIYRTIRKVLADFSGFEKTSMTKMDGLARVVHTGTLNTVELDRKLITTFELLRKMDSKLDKVGALLERE